MGTFKKTAMWTGIVLTGLCGIVLLGGGKIGSGSLLIVTAFTMALLVGRSPVPVWLRVVLICAVFALVIANISTTQIPDPSDPFAMGCGEELAFDYEPSGFKFLDQVVRIFNTFLAEAAPS
ncbi:MAG: hypothetical protein HOQ43_21400 [Glycomyces artemisiae]|uniref:Uncharacterized protein n=1 Tax=Glycomyces artemisiae TaxID=1076443 RepID=A0A850CGK9_9ACTN|nr:hypothetical protein [Glycomyces artemisiae]